ncbi:hypothetical protein SAMN04487914_12951 [Arthrobacter sp. ok909]|uniref:hypothetical protein n=1 Tax=Arthrobacter sp. ok909 TaxID=1761746 RepID=UPI00088FF2CC|nr:hypothetical protein [Arthrobacter sp. ok909]SDP71698.1 hypothetical protein SAMN04487914_12951 [Arthrobacter sp. ok909]
MAKYRVNKTDDQPLHPAEPDRHWRQLRRGDRVSVRLAPGFETGGLVDAVTADHSVVWVDLDGGRGRTLLHCGDGVEIWPHDS